MAMRYFYVYHHLPESFSPQIVIHTYNKLHETMRDELAEEFALFFRVVMKLGKNKFISFVGRNSENLRGILEVSKKESFIGYMQEAASPYSSRDLCETIQVPRGQSEVRYF